MKNYPTEVEGQRDFYRRFSIDPDVSHNMDGVYKGNLFENKLNIDNIHRTLFQAVKYASRIRERGEKLPANLILNDLNREMAYLFRSQDLLPDIEKVYFGAASRDNEGYSPPVEHTTLDYSTPEGVEALAGVIKSEHFTRYHIDHSNIHGLSRVYYRTRQDKDSFLRGTNAEIRRPVLLQDRVIPYDRADNVQFQDIMDCLNPALLQREQGAYYTPEAYVKQMHAMLLRAIGNVPRGMDYVIIDRCAGTGNLEEGLPDEVLRHCILSTIEANEYQILRWKYGDQCAVIIPNTDALAHDIVPAATDDAGHITNEYVRERVRDPNCAVLLLENPPFSEAGSGGAQTTGRKENQWKKSYVIGEMRREVEGVALNELSNLFIWSGFRFYLTKATDAYILYSPTKYWRNQNLVRKKFMDGFLCNRREFHARQHSAMGCIWWQNVDDDMTERLELTPYDIVDGRAVRCTEANGDILLRKAHHKLSEAYDNRVFTNDRRDGIICEKDGREFVKDGRKIMVNPLYNPNMIAYMQTDSFSIDRKVVHLTRGALYNGHGFYVRSDNFVEKLPLFVAAVFPYDKWWKADVYSKTYDGGGRHIQDRRFLKKCLLYTLLTPKNKCRSLRGSDGRFYRNELCCDGDDTQASLALKHFEQEGNGLSPREEILMKYWQDVLFEAKRTAEYDKMIQKEEHIRLGLFQIMEELNIKVPTGRQDRRGQDILQPKYPELNTEVEKLKNALREYYAKEIIPDLFQYELIK